MVSSSVALMVGGLSSSLPHSGSVADATQTDSPATPPSPAATASARPIARGVRMTIDLNSMLTADDVVVKERRLARGGVKL